MSSPRNSIKREHKEKEKPNHDFGKCAGIKCVVKDKSLNLCDFRDLAIARGLFHIERKNGINYYLFDLVSNEIYLRVDKPITRKQWQERFDFVENISQWPKDCSHSKDLIKFCNLLPNGKWVFEIINANLFLTKKVTPNSKNYCQEENSDSKSTDKGLVGEPIVETFRKQLRAGVKTYTELLREYVQKQNANYVQILLSNGNELDSESEWRHQSTNTDSQEPNRPRYQSGSVNLSTQHPGNYNKDCLLVSNTTINASQSGNVILAKEFSSSAPILYPTYACKEVRRNSSDIFEDASDVIDSEPPVRKKQHVDNFSNVLRPPNSVTQQNSATINNSALSQSASSLVSEEENISMLSDIHNVHVLSQPQPRPEARRSRFTRPNTSNRRFWLEKDTFEFLIQHAFYQGLDWPTIKEFLNVKKGYANNKLDRWWNEWQHKMNTSQVRSVMVTNKELEELFHDIASDF